MGFIKKLFSKNKHETKYIDEEQSPNIPQIEDDLICSQCNMIIHPSQRVKTFAGKKMHMKPCWFKIRKTAKNLMQRLYNKFKQFEFLNFVW